jgi:hypothetical protein
LRERFKIISGIRVIEDLATVELLNVVQVLDRCIKDQLETAREDHGRYE